MRAARARLTYAAERREPAAHASAVFFAAVKRSWEIGPASTMESKCTIIRAHFLPTWTGLRSALRDKTDLEVRTNRIAYLAWRDAAPPSGRSTDRAHRRAIPSIGGVASPTRERDFFLDRIGKGGAAEKRGSMNEPRK